MELHLGKMKSVEIAEWLGVAYSTFRNNSKKQFSKLDNYCEYKKVWGGIEITKIYCPVYKGEAKRCMVKDYIAEVKDSPISSAAGVARKFKAEEKTGYEEYKVETLRNNMAKVARFSFGKPQIPNHFDLEKSGVYGYRYNQWVIKTGDYNEYRPMSEKEYQIFKDIVSETCHTNPDKIIEMNGLIQDFKNGDITQDEFLEVQDDSKSFFSMCLREFMDRTGVIPVRCSNHHLASYEEMQALEEEQKGAFVAEDKSVK